jgi:hypothetical protein
LGNLVRDLPPEEKAFFRLQKCDLRYKKVGLVGFEPTASSSRTRRSTKLSHSPKSFRAQQLVGYFAYFRAAGKKFRWQNLAFVGRLDVLSNNSAALAA